MGKGTSSLPLPRFPFYPISLFPLSAYFPISPFTLFPYFPFPPIAPSPSSGEHHADLFGNREYPRADLADPVEAPFGPI